MTGGARPEKGTLVVLFTPRAMRELLAAVTWWRKNRLEDPRMIDSDVERALRRIAAFPRSAPIVRGRDARRLVLRCSGYLLFYRVRPRLGRIEVILVVHGRQAVSASGARTSR
jgi:plasmid stabilization system protein ParE